MGTKTNTTKLGILARVLSVSLALNFFSVALAASMSSSSYTLEHANIQAAGAVSTGSSYTLEGGTTTVNVTSISSNYAVQALESSPVCGNGSIEDGESCDTDAFGSASCASYGYDTGTLSCSSTCTIDTSTCSNTPTGGSGSSGGGGRGSGTSSTSTSSTTTPPPSTTASEETNTTATPDSPETNTPEENTPTESETERNTQTFTNLVSDLSKNINQKIVTADDHLDETASELDTDSEAQNSEVSDRNEPLHPAASRQSISEIEFHVQAAVIDATGMLETESISETIDDTPVLAGTLDTKQDYTLVITDETGEIIAQEAITTDINGVFVHETKTSLDTGSYTFSVLTPESGEDSEVLQTYALEIVTEDLAHTATTETVELTHLNGTALATQSVFDTELKKDVNYLGTIVRAADTSIISGKVEPLAEVYIYLSSAEWHAMKTIAHADGFFEFEIPDQLEYGAHRLQIVTISPKDGLTLMSRQYTFDLVREQSVWHVVGFVTLVLAVLSLVAHQFSLVNKIVSQKTNFFDGF